MPCLLGLNAFPFFWGKMSLPQTVYFSISNFLYKLTQPNIHMSPNHAVCSFVIIQMTTSQRKTNLEIVSKNQYSFNSDTNAE